MNEEEKYQLRELIQDLQAILGHGGSYPMSKEVRDDINKQILDAEERLAENKITNPFAWS